MTASTLNAAVLAWSPVVPLLLRAHGASAGAVVATYAAWNLLAAASQFVGGRLADRFGARALILYPTAIAGSFWMAMGILTHLGPWLGMALAFIAVETVFGIQSTSFVTFVSDSAPPEGRAAAFARFQWPVAVGYVLGPLAGALWILPHLAPSLFITATGALYWVVFAIRRRLLAPPPYEVLTRPQAGLAETLRPAVLVRDLVRGSFGGPRRRRLLALTVGVSTLFALTVSGPFLALVGHALDGLSSRTIEFLFAVGPVASVVLGAVSGPWVSRVGAMRALALSSVVLGAVALALAFRHGMAAMIVLFLLLFGAFQLASVAFGTVRASLAEGGESGISIGSSSAFAGVAAFAVLTVISSLPAARASEVALAAAALVGVGTSLVALSSGRGHVTRPPGRAVLAEQMDAAKA